MQSLRLKLVILAFISVCLAMNNFHSASAQGELPPPPGFKDWNDVLVKARGQTVNWYMWGGSDTINNFVDKFYGKGLKEEFGITLNRVPIADTVDAVNQVLTEAKAGITDSAGKIDLIWINGENFYTLSQAKLLYGPWSQSIPNSALVAWDNPAVNLDFGRPINDYESPWSSAQFHFMYDTKRINDSDLPHSYADLTRWIEKHPGRFTYIAPGPGAFIGTRFVKQIFFEVSGGHDQWVGKFNQDLYDKWAPEVWSMLNSWKPNLWRKGETYATNEADLHQLFANNEVDFDFTQLPSGAATFIDAGQVPPTTRAFTFDKNMIGDFNYVAIPFDAPDKAAALVLANLILRPDMQSAQVQPKNGFGLGFGIDVTNVTDDAGKKAISDTTTNLGDAAAPTDKLATALVSDIAPEYQALIEKDWTVNVLQTQ